MAISVSFPELLRKHLEKSGVTQRSFAEKTGISGGYPAHFLSGERPPPLDRLTQMIDVLKLTEEEASEFSQAAHLAHAPEEVRSLVRRLRLDLAHERGDLIDLRDKISAISAELSSAKAELNNVKGAFRSLLSVLRERKIKLPQGLPDV